MYQNLILEKENRIAILYINRPEVFNALNKDTLLEIIQVTKEVEEDKDVDVLIITGSGNKAFVAGADIAYMRNLTAVEAKEFGDLGQKAFLGIEKMSKPVIAAVNGFALGGGCELAMSCDFRIASTKAKFGQPEVSLGITPGFGGTQRLTRLIGLGMAKQMLYTGDIIDATEAQRIGLVNDVTLPEDLISNAKKVAQRIVKNGQIAVRLCKTAVNEGLQTDIERGLSIEAHAFGLCFATVDQKEGMTAFLEKRQAIFTES